MSNVLTLLVTGVGAPGIWGTLYALRHNPDGWPVRIIGVDIQQENAGAVLVDRLYRVPEPEKGEYVEALVDISKREQVVAVLPQTTREIATLSTALAAIEKEGIRVMVSDARAIAAANNKRVVMEVFRRLGLPTAACQLTRSESELVGAARKFGYPELPVVVKPSVSNGMRGVRVVVPEPWDVRRFLSEKPHGLEISLEVLIGILRRGEWPELLVMEYLPGEEYTVDAFCGSRFAIAVPRQRLSVRSGITFHSRTELRKDLIEYALSAGRELGLRYVFGFQFKLDGAGIPKVLECNPRIQGTMVASVFSGANVVWFGVREVLGDPINGLSEPLHPSEFLRYWGGVAVNGRVIAEV